MSQFDQLPVAGFGLGVYFFPQAASIVGRRKDVSTRTLKRWMKSGLTPPTFEPKGKPEILTFHDLISLEIVRRFRSQGASLQSVRRVEVALRERHPELVRPFAHRLFSPTAPVFG